MSNILTPPILKGTEREQLTQMRDYLFQLQRQLQTALTAVEDGNFSAAGTEMIVKTAAIAAKQTGAGTADSISQQAATLKSLIIKTADRVKATEESISAILESDYVANSDFGDYKETVKTQINATASGIEQQIQYAADIAAIANNATNLALNDYIVKTNGFIRQGIVGYDGATPILGIAIGQSISPVKVGDVEQWDDVDGVSYPIIDKSTEFLSIHSATGLSFYLWGQEVAYINNNKLFITEANITNKLIVGDWEINHTSGFTIKWVGA